MGKPENNEPEVMSASEVRQHFSEVVNRVARGEGRVIVEKNGAPAVAMVSMDDIQRLRQIDLVLDARRSFVEEFRARFEGVTEEELERENQKIFDEIRVDVAPLLRTEVDGKLAKLKFC